MRNPPNFFLPYVIQNPPKKSNSTKNGIFGIKKPRCLQNDSRRSHIRLQIIPYSFLLMDIENHPKKWKTPQKTAKIQKKGIFTIIFNIFTIWGGGGSCKNNQNIHLVSGGHKNSSYLERLGLNRFKKINYSLFLKQFRLLKKVTCIS